MQTLYPTPPVVPPQKVFEPSWHPPQTPSQKVLGGLGLLNMAPRSVDEVRRT